MVSISRDRIGNSITMAWLTKITSHMDGEELLGQIIMASLMANSKMEHSMAILDGFGMVVTVGNLNFKMVIF